jgi:phospholipid/cholesterol/gamma-HCH transport system substrate-binding protein
VELRYRREATVGAFLIVATVAFVFGMMWLRGKALRRGEIIAAVFSNVVGLKVGDQVRTSGVAIGSVDEILLDRPGRVIVRLELKRHQEPRTDARAIVRALDLFGARYVDYQPGIAATMLPADSPIVGEREPDFTEMASDLSGEGRRVLGNAAELVGPATTQELRGTLLRAQALLEDLRRSSRQPAEELVGALQGLRQVLQRLDLLAGDDANRQTLTNLRDLSANLVAVTATMRNTVRTMDTLVGKVNDGRGTLGQLVNDTTLLFELRRTNNHLDSLVTDFMAHPRKYVSVSVF